MSQILKAVAVLKSGGVIAYPTDTVYGLGVNIFNDNAVRRVFKLKGRDFKKPLSVALASFEMMEDLAEISPESRRLIKKLLPGPTTVILPKKGKVSNLVSAGEKTIGIRYPEHPATIEIIRRAGFPITATSANLAGEKEIFKARDIKLAVHFVVAGSCKYKIPSTVVDLKNYKIIRPGAEIKKVKGILELI